MYEIKIARNDYTNKDQYVLYYDGCNSGTISDKNIKLFLERNIPLNDSKGIEQYLKYNNL